MATMFYDRDADLNLIRSKKVAVMGYGSQGHAHALNLKDSGVSVRVGLPATSRSREKARAAGLTVGDVAEVTKWADVVMILIPDTAQPKVYREEIEPNLAPGNMLMFAHGFNIRFNCIVPPKDVDVTMVAPKAPGHRVREVFKEGGGTPREARCAHRFQGGAGRLGVPDGAGRRRPAQNDQTPVADRRDGGRLASRYEVETRRFGSISHEDTKTVLCCTRSQFTSTTNPAS